jgi:hypothetical protein
MCLMESVPKLASQLICIVPTLYSQPSIVTPLVSYADGDVRMIRLPVVDNIFVQ